MSKLTNTTIGASIDAPHHSNPGVEGDFANEYADVLRHVGKAKEADKMLKQWGPQPKAVNKTAK